jgi:hypothetical protein
MLFTALGTPSPFLGTQIDAGKFQFGRATATLSYEMEVLGPQASVSILIDVSGRVFADVGLDGSGTAVAQSNWSFEDVVLGPVFSDALDSGVQHEPFSQSFSHKVFVTVTANHIHRVTMSVDLQVGGGSFGGNGTALIDPVFSFAPGVDPAYSFQFSDGIGNSSPPAAPEPGSALLLSTGAVAIGLLRRRSRLRGASGGGMLNRLHETDIPPYCLSVAVMRIFSASATLIPTRTGTNFVSARGAKLDPYQPWGKVGAAWVVALGEEWGQFRSVDGLIGHYNQGSGSK